MRFPLQISPQNRDEEFMLKALNEAWVAFCNDEVPIGAVLVHEEKIIARGYNQVELLKDATAHAEMITLTAGAAAFGDWRLEKCTLYCTIEPCSMCAGAVLLSRVSRVVWGAPDLRHGANGSWVNLFDKPHPTHSVEISGGVLQEPCAYLMREFFQKRRGKSF